MAIEFFDPNTPLDYVPAFANNRESTEPCVVKLKYVPYVKMLTYERLIIEKTKGDRTKVGEVLPEVQKKQFLDSVENVSGFFVGKRAVTDPDEFYEVADSALIVEIIRAMENPCFLKEGLLGNDSGGA